MTRRLYLLAAILAGLAVPALAVDLPVAAWFPTAKLPGGLSKLISLAEVFAHGLGVAAIVLTAYVLDLPHRRRLPRLAACTFGAGLAADVIKLVVARHRPGTQVFQHVAETFAGWLPGFTQGWRQIANHDIQSFPSSHTATAAGLAVGLTWLYPQGRWLFAGLVVLAALQRWQGSAHFVSDTLAGAALGCLWAGYCLGPGKLGKLFDRFEAGRY